MRSRCRKCCRPTGRFDEGWAPNTGPPTTFSDFLVRVLLLFNYPLVNVYITMENHHFQLVNQWTKWPFSSSLCNKLPEGTRCICCHGTSMKSSPVERWNPQRIHCWFQKNPNLGMGWNQAQCLYNLYTSVCVHTFFLHCFPPKLTWNGLAAMVRPLGAKLPRFMSWTSALFWLSAPLETFQFLWVFHASSMHYVDDWAPFWPFCHTWTISYWTSGPLDHWVISWLPSGKRLHNYGKSPCY